MEIPQIDLEDDNGAGKGVRPPPPLPMDDPEHQIKMMLDRALAPRDPFAEFCEETTLNGWYYLAKRGVGLIPRSYWVLVVFASLCAAAFFCHGATTEWLGSTTLITVDSVSASLDKVVFPAITVCNQNQVFENNNIIDMQGGF